MLRKINKPLVSILFLALVLRLVGINHGFPFIFHPDEPTVVRSALGVRFYPNPQHFDWPHLYIYLNYFLYMVFAKVRTLVEVLNLKSFVVSFLPIVWNDDLVFYLLTRCFTAMLGALTVIPIYLTGKYLFGRKIGLLSALTLAIFPFHVWHSHYSLPDVPMIFFLSWGLYFSARIVFEENLRNYILAGLFVGLSASTKYNGGLSAIAVLLAHVLRKGIRNWKFTSLKDLWLYFKGLVISGFCSVLAFFMGTPYALLDFKTFIRADGPKGALWQFTNVGKVAFLEQLKQFLTIFWDKLIEDFGFTFVLIFVLLVFWWGFKLYKKGEYNVNKQITFLIVPALCLLFYVSGFSKNRSHYYMVVYPFVAVLVGYFTNGLLRRAEFKVLRSILVVCIFSVPLMLSIKGSLAFAGGDTRIDLYTWMLAHVTPTDRLIYDGDDLVPILREFPDNKIEKSKHVGVMDFVKSQGYLITAVEKDESISVFDGRVPLSVLTLDNPLWVVTPKFKRGPEIWVYSLPVIR